VLAAEINTALWEAEQACKEGKLPAALAALKRAQGPAARRRLARLAVRLGPLP
jgi:hypothetical protein